MHGLGVVCCSLFVIRCSDRISSLMDIFDSNDLTLKARAINLLDGWKPALGKIFLPPCRGSMRDLISLDGKQGTPHGCLYGCPCRRRCVDIGQDCRGCVQGYDLGQGTSFVGGDVHTCRLSTRRRLSFSSYTY